MSSPAYVFARPGIRTRVAAIAIVIALAAVAAFAVFASPTQVPGGPSAVAPVQQQAAPPAEERQTEPGERGD